ncbi:MAG TPA: hypothetical protein VJU87_00305 [Gemmatimonadaceae bacterium]|nr:hypothetical protein [Gemmatimonadaceae bacterium]
MTPTELPRGTEAARVTTGAPMPARAPGTPGAASPKDESGYIIAVG